MTLRRNSSNVSTGSSGPLLHSFRHAERNSAFVIRDVYSSNLHSEFALLREAIVKHHTVSVDIEYPGVVGRSTAEAKDVLFENLRCNIDLLSPIQVAFSLCDGEGNLPQVEGVDVGAWQFNLKFSLKSDLYAPASIELLERAGVNFERLETNGIDQQEFGELLISSGLVIQDEVSMVAFHGGYVLAYLWKLMTCKEMPSALEQFVDSLQLFLPTFWDLRLIKSRFDPEWSKGSLDALAHEFNIKREPGLTAHQAGSDSFLALKTFIAMKASNMLHPSNQGTVYGLEPKPKSASSSPALQASSNSMFLPQLAPVLSMNGAENEQTPDKGRGGYRRQ